MLKPFALALAFLLTGPALAQTAVIDFDYMLKKIEKNYSGFPDKVTPATRPAYDAITRQTRDKLLNAKPEEIPSILNEWIAFFKDQHLSIGPMKMDNAEPLATETRPPIDALAFKNELSKKKSLQGYEGIWSNANYTIAITPVAGQTTEWEGIIIDSKSDLWKPGQVKLKIADDGKQPVGTWIMGDRSVRVAPLVSKAQKLALDFGGVLVVRSWPPVPGKVDLDRLVPQDRVFLKKLSPRTLLWRLPDFHHENKAVIEKLLVDHKADLERTDNWVIDLRNNGGGDDSTYAELEKYLYTRPIYSIGMEMLATEDNMKKFTDLLANPEYGETEKGWFRQIVERMKAGMGTFVLQGDKPYNIKTRKEILPYPKHVGILITGAGSSGEQFVLMARQSHKVTTFGGRTEGVLDYANVADFKTPGGWQVNYPTSRSLRTAFEPIDNIGLPPDMAIPDTVSDQVSMVQVWLEKQPDFPVK